jgi:hypothetical protein
MFYKLNSNVFEIPLEGNNGYKTLNFLLYLNLTKNFKILSKSTGILCLRPVDTNNSKNNI